MVAATLEITLEQLSRALAAHVMLTAHSEKLHDFMAPETAEKVAAFIHLFALGEPVNRPELRECGYL
jgi:hypothetical protein